MEAMKLNVCIFTFSYGGNGGIASSHPDLLPWMVETCSKAKADSRVGWVKHIDLADTPITMTRNRAVNIARELGADVILMVDSDQSPDVHLGPNANFQDKEAQPFWDSSFDYLYKHWTKGPCMIGSPYCGPPQFQENVYVFHWVNNISGNPNSDYSLEAYTRHEAARMSGIQECAALPTGLILFDIRCFDLVDPPYFYYEWKDKFQAEKGSTEDVTATRDISMNGIQKLGYNPVLCNWSAWAGHWKPKCVGKPMLITASDVSDKLKKAVLEGHDSTERIVQVKGDLAAMKKPIVVSPEEFYPQTCSAKPLESKNPELVAWFIATTYGSMDNYLAACKKFAPDDAEKAARFAVLGQTMIEPGGHHTPAFDLICLKRVVADAIEAKRDGRSFQAIELGSWAGHSSIAIADMLPKGGQLHCVDTWNGTDGEATGTIASNYGEIFKVFTKNIGSRLGSTILPFNATSQTAAGYFVTDNDLIFIDADHSYEAVKADIQAWLPHVKPGGFICGHDYQENATPGVVQAVDELLPDAKVYGCVWYYQVPVKVEQPPRVAPRVSLRLRELVERVRPGSEAKVNVAELYFNSGWDHEGTHLWELPEVVHSYRNSGGHATYKGKPIDLLYVSPGDTEQAMYDSIASWLPHLSKGGIVCGGGYDQPHVKAAVDKLFGAAKVPPQENIWSITVHDARVVTKQPEMEAAGV